MRCYYGAIPESDHKARYGYTQKEYTDLKDKHPHILITWFPVESKYSACVPSEGYRDLGEMCDDKMQCLTQAIKIYEQTNHS